MTVVASKAGGVSAATAQTSFSGTPAEGNTIILTATIGSTTETLSAPSGWVPVGTFTHTNNDYLRTYVWRRTATPGLAAPLLSASASKIIVWSAVEVLGDVGTITSAAEYSAASGGTVTMPGIAVAASSTVLNIAVHKMGGSTVGAWTPGTGLTAGDEHVDFTRTGGHMATAVYATEETSATSARTATYTGSAENHWMGITLVAPDAVVTPPTTGGGGTGDTPAVTVGAVAKGDANSITVTLPAHTTGQLLLLFAGIDDDPTTVTDPAGWTLVATAAGNGSRAAAWSKVAASASETNPTIGLSTTTDFVAWAAVLDEGATVDVFATSTSNVAPTVTTTGANRRIVRFAATDGGGDHSWSGATELGDDVSAASGGLVKATIATSEQATAGASGTATVTPSSNTATTITVAVGPADITEDPDTLYGIHSPVVSWAREHPNAVAVFDPDSWDNVQGGWPVTVLDPTSKALAIVPGSKKAMWFGTLADGTEALWLDQTNTAATVAAEVPALLASTTWTIEGRAAAALASGSNQRLFRLASTSYAYLHSGGTIRYNDGSVAHASASTVETLLGVGDWTEFEFRVVVDGTSLDIDVRTVGGSWVSALAGATIASNAASGVGLYLGSQSTAESFRGQCNLLRVRDGGVSASIVAEFTPPLFPAGNRGDGATAVDEHDVTWTLANPPSTATDEPTIIHAGPQRFSMPGVAGQSVSTPDSPANSITGDLDVRVLFEAGSYIPPSTPGGYATFASKWETGQQSWLFRGYRSGAVDQLNVAWDQASGGVVWTSRTVPSFDGIDGVRFTMDVDDGAGNCDLRYWTTVDGGETWDQLGVPAVVAATSFKDSSAAVAIGARGAAAASDLCLIDWTYAEVRDGIDGPVVSRFHAADADPDSDTWTDPVTEQVNTINRSTGAGRRLELIEEGQSAVIFDGTDLAVLIGDDLSSFGDEGVTLVVDARYHESTSSSVRLLSNVNASSVGTMLALTGTDPRVQGYVDDGPTTVAVGDNADNITPGRRFVAMAALKSGSSAMFIDGTEVESSSTALTPFDATLPFALGADADGSSGGQVTIFGAAILRGRATPAEAVAAVVGPTRTTTGTNNDGPAWVIAKVTHTRDDGATTIEWHTAQFTLDNGNVVVDPGDPEPDPDPPTVSTVPVGTLKDRLAFYSGNSSALVRTRAEESGVDPTGIGCTYQVAGGVPWRFRRMLIESFVYGSNDVPGALAYPDQFTCWNMGVADGDLNGVNPRDSATTQATRFQQVLDDVDDAHSHIDRAVTAYGALVDGTPGIHHFVRIGHEINLSSQRHAPFPANVTLWGELVGFIHSRFVAGLTPTQLEYIVFDFSIGKRNERGTTLEDLWSQNPTIYRTASINAYLDKAPGVNSHINPAQFAATPAYIDPDNILTPQGRADLIANMTEGAGRMNEHRAFFQSKGVPVGMGEGASGTGLTTQSAGRRAQWAHADGLAIGLWMDWWSEYPVPFWSIQNEQGGGVGTRTYPTAVLPGMPAVVQAIRSKLATM